MTPLPPNPYTLGPIKKRERLAGRSSELKELKYYLGLVQAGQTPHLALIGNRGVGKTSLLLAAAELAKDHSLLPVAVDLDESKVRSAGVFWHDFYSTLTLAAAKAGCWGGVTGRIYSSLFEQLYQRKVVDLEMAVLQFPLAIARHDGDLTSLPCPDALVVHDFGTVLMALQECNLKGMALLLDEGDCLSQHRGLLQTLRNVLQRVERTCFLITGTESLFDTVSDVFSPIPRQFHRLDISRFSEWTQTFELLQHPTPDRVRPAIPTVVELHDVCQGDPTELQLYCHHMYKAVEDGHSVQMELTPGVYRAVRRAYRAHSQAVDVKVLNAIDELPDELLVKSRWLRRRRLSLDENVDLERLRKELGDGQALSADKRQQLYEEISEGYKELYERGISSSSTSLDLVGGAVTAGYWKSRVQTERAVRWAWVDDDLLPLIRRTITNELSQSIDNAIVREYVGENEIDATVALERLRAGNQFKNVSRLDVSTSMLVFVEARKQGMQQLVDVSYLLEDQRTTGFTVSYVGSNSREVRHLAEAWIADREQVLRERGITVSIEAIKELDCPTSREIGRLARVAGIVLPSDMFGPSVMQEAVELFLGGDLDGGIELLETMLQDRDDPWTRNNLGYCLLATGRIEEALAHLKSAAEDENAAEDERALRIHNLAIAEVLNGSPDLAKETLQRAWRIQESNPDEEEVVCMLLLSPDQESVRSTEGLALTAALLVNMYTIGAMEAQWCEEKLSERYGEQYLRWLEERPQ